MKKIFLVLLLAFFSLMFAEKAGGFESLDVKSWLSKPGVKLVAVEFYSTWCKPCMEAVPKWEALRRKYRDKGLRLIVVSVRDAAGCAVPAWSPDANVCDEDGQIQELWKADPLPKAFLFNWQGSLLVKAGGFDDVQKAVEQYFAETPRILVEDPTDENGQKLKNALEIKKSVRQEFKRLSKFDIVADDKEMEEISKLRKKYNSSNYDESTGCKLGKDVSANSQLKITVKKNTRDGKAQLRLELFSMEQGCLLAASRAPAPDVHDFEQPIAEAVADLVQTLIGDFQSKNVAGLEVVKKTAKQKIDTMEKEGAEMYSGYVPNSNSEEIVVSFESDPVGAKVYFRGVKICDKTPCKTEVMSGKATFEFKPPNDKYETVSVDADIKRGMPPVMGKLAAKFGTLTVNSDPQGIDVKLDGYLIGKTPINDYEITEGRHKVEVGDAAHVAQWKEFGVNRGEKKEYSFKLAARQGGLKAKAKTSEGEPLEGKVFIDDVELGYTGKVFAVNVGVHKARVKTEKGEDEKSVDIKEGQEELVQFVINVSPTLPGGQINIGGGSTTGSAEIEWVPSKINKLSGLMFAKKETTVEQFKKCVDAGACKTINFKTNATGSSCNYGDPRKLKSSMNCVDWTASDAFCKWAGGRLPTKDEWITEATADGSRKYPNGSSSGSGEDLSVSGVKDMINDLFEWTSSYSDGTNKYPVFMLSTPGNTTNNSNSVPTFQMYTVGFRCVMQNSGSGVGNFGGGRRDRGLNAQTVISGSTGYTDSAGVEWVPSKVAQNAGLMFSKREITVGQFQKCLNAGICKTTQISKNSLSDKECNLDRGGPNMSMNCVDWNGADAFCKWVGGSIPTKDEWFAEATNGGAWKFPWGNQDASSDYVLETGVDYTKPNCSKPKGNSVSGVCDLYGGLFEWLGSFSDANKSYPEFNMPSSNNIKYISNSVPTFKMYTVGFRCVKSAASTGQLGMNSTTNAGNNSIDLIDWINVPSGSFTMGCDENGANCSGEESPAHYVSVKAFKLMKYEVTQAQYQKVMGNNPSADKNCGTNCPVTNVTWSEAKQFCEKIGGRLPSDAEWEYAARAGTGTPFICGSNESCVKDYAWYSVNSGNKLHPVGQKLANAWGFYDIIGNVLEWVADTYHWGFKGAPSDGKPWGVGGEKAIIRGGGFGRSGASLRVTYRPWNYPTVRDSNYGIRCAADI